MFGVATADHQCEAFNSKCVDIRDWWEGMGDPKAARGKATDFWHRYEEDIDKAKKLGCSAFRFSIAWSRIEPKPGQFNQEAIEHYRKLIDKIISCRYEAGIDAPSLHLADTCARTRRNDGRRISGYLCQLCE